VNLSPPSRSARYSCWPPSQRRQGCEDSRNLTPLHRHLAVEFYRAPAPATSLINVISASEGALNSSVTSALSPTARPFEAKL
jgi:hypothetical protein